MAKGVDIRWNIGEFVRIANEVNESVCVPLAESVAATARGSAPFLSGEYKGSIGVSTDPRSGVGDWAHAYVEATDDKAMVIESRTGNLARALGSA